MSESVASRKSEVQKIEMFSKSSNDKKMLSERSYSVGRGYNKENESSQERKWRTVTEGMKRKNEGERKDFEKIDEGSKEVLQRKLRLLRVKPEMRTDKNWRVKGVVDAIGRLSEEEMEKYQRTMSNIGSLQMRETLVDLAWREKEGVERMKKKKEGVIQKVLESLKETVKIDEEEQTVRVSERYYYMLLGLGESDFEILRRIRESCY